MVTENPGPQPIWRIFKITFNNIDFKSWKCNRLKLYYATINNQRRVLIVMLLIKCNNYCILYFGIYKFINIFRNIYDRIIKY